MYTDVETTEESMYSTNSFNDEDPGFGFGDSNGSGNIWPGFNYASPWDFLFRQQDGKQPAYVMVNGNSENFSPYTIEIFAYVGLAYFDGDNNGVYDDQFTGNSFPINNGNYPNLWDGQKEVGNLIRVAVPHVLNPGDPSLRLEAERDHLPIVDSAGNISMPAYSAYDDVFDFSGVITLFEEDLLKQYGKVFFYEVNVWQGGTFIGDYMMHPFIETVQAAQVGWGSGQHWHPVMDAAQAIHYDGHVPNVGDYPLYFYWNQGHNTGTVFDPQNLQNPFGPQSICDSREVVFQMPPNMHSYALPNGQYLNMYILQNSKYLWLNSMVVVGVE